MNASRKNGSRVALTIVAGLIGAVALSLAISRHAVSPEEDRSFRMGMMYWPPRGEQTEDAQLRQGLDRALHHAEVLVAQVPWSPSQTDIVRRARWLADAARDNGRGFAVAFDWMHANRYHRVDTRETPWSFADPGARAAYLESVRDTVERLDPAYLVLGVEVNYLLFVDPAEFDPFVSLAREAAALVDRISPKTKTTVTFQYELLVGHRPVVPAFRGAPNAFGDALDVLGVSTYPSTVLDSPGDIPPDYYEALRAFDLPIAVFECSWPTPVDRDPGLAEFEQTLYLKRALNDFNRLEAELVVWAAALDTETGPLGASPLGSSTDPKWRWRLGLWRTDASPKPAASSWTDWTRRAVNLDRAAARSAPTTQPTHD